MKKLLILTAGVAAGTIAWAPMAHADDAIHGATLNFVRGAMKRALLTREREFELARSWRETGDQTALHELINAYTRLVIATATPEQTVPQTAAFVADALGVHMSWFFRAEADAPAEERGVVVRRSNRRRFAFMHRLCGRLPDDLVILDQHDMHYDSPFSRVKR